MFTAIQGVAGLLSFIESPLAAFRMATDRWAAEAREKRKMRTGASTGPAARVV